jgi:hypothetical protein
MKLRRTNMVLAIAAGLLGTAHLALTPLFYRDWTIGSLWFVGTGLAMLIGAGANLIAAGAGGAGGGGERMRRLALVAINLAMTAFFASAWPVLPEPQVVLGGILFAGLAVCAALSGTVAAEQEKPDAR